MEQKANQVQKKEIKKRNYNLNQQLIIVDNNKLDPDDIESYHIAVCLPFDEFLTFKVDILNLKRVLLSEGQKILGYVFEYYDKDNQPCRDMLISKPLSERYYNAFVKAPKDNISVLVTQKNGEVLGGIKSQIVLKK